MASSAWATSEHAPATSERSERCCVDQSVGETNALSAWRPTRHNISTAQFGAPHELDGLREPRADGTEPKQNDYQIVVSLAFKIN
jgi:hypothetical protein